MWYVKNSEYVKAEVFSVTWSHRFLGGWWWSLQQHLPGPIRPLTMWLWGGERLYVHPEFPHLVQPSSLHWTNHWMYVHKLMICTRKPKQIRTATESLWECNHVWVCHTHWNRDHCTIDCNRELFGLALIALNQWWSKRRRRCLLVRH